MQTLGYLGQMTTTWTAKSQAVVNVKLQKANLNYNGCVFLCNFIACAQIIKTHKRNAFIAVEECEYYGGGGGIFLYFLACIH